MIISIILNFSLRKPGNRGFLSGQRKIITRPPRRKMADRIQARAIRRCGELLKQVEADKGGYHKNYAHDGTDTSITRTQAAAAGNC